ncbi:MAG TPA: hypothetical protein VF945_06575 [Polyangia bacterium]
MRKIVMAAGVVALMGGAALAAAPDEPSGAHTRRVERGVFDAAGGTEAEVVYRECPAGHVTTNWRRTGGDVLTALVTAGWYTPRHVTFRCSR